MTQTYSEKLFHILNDDFIDQREISFREVMAFEHGDDWGKAWEDPQSVTLGGRAAGMFLRTAAFQTFSLPQRIYLTLYFVLNIHHYKWLSIIYVFTGKEWNNSGRASWKVWKTLWEVLTWKKTILKQKVSAQYFTIRLWSTGHKSLYP